MIVVTHVQRVVINRVKGLCSVLLGQAPSMDDVPEQLKALCELRRVDVACTHHTFTSIWAQRQVRGLVTEHHPGCQA